MQSTSFALAVDVGTSRLAAATARVAADGSIQSESFTLGRRGDSVATVVFVGEDGELLFGDAAERRGVAQPERLVREFKRSVGDDVPLQAGGRSLTPADLYAQTVASVVETVAEREGAPPDVIALTHPTAWGPHRLGLIETALARLGIRDVLMISEPEAAARHYEASRPLEAGTALAVYDLGGGTFDSVVLCKDGRGGFEPVGDPVGIDDLGGADFDDAVLRHVLTAAGVDVASLSTDDPDTALALAQLRRECVDAKEALSFDSDAAIPVLIAAERSSVRLTRTEFEHMIGPSLDRTLEALESAVDSAETAGARVDAILLIGGSSRIPLVAQRLSERFDLPVAVDADPKAAIALGAARTALIRHHDRALAIVPAGPEAAAAATGTALALAPTAAPPAMAAPAAAATAARRSSPMLVAGSALLIAGAIVFGTTLTAGSGGDPSAAVHAPKASPTETTTPSATPSAPAAAAPTEQQAAPSADSSPPRRSAPPSRAKVPPRQTTTTAPAANPKSTPNTKPAASSPKPSTGSTPSPSQPGGTTTTPTDPDPTVPPTDPDPTTPPADPDPSTPPADPDPSTPPSDPTPSDPPADPGPSDPPVEPTQAPPPPGPAPDPAPDPAPEPDPAPAPDPAPSPTEPV